MPFDTINLIGD